MDDKNTPKNPDLTEEKVLDFETAKDLTIGQAVKKHEEIQAGVTDDDSLLDRYIKQHREEIESQKFETKSVHLPLTEAVTDEEPEEEVEVANVAETQVITPALETAPLEETVVATPVIDPVTSTELPTEEEVDEEWAPAEEDKSSKKKVALFALLALLFIGLVATAFMWMNSVNQDNQTASSTSSSQVNSSSSSAVDANQEAFNQLYASFFADSDLTKIKNSEFGKLPELKTLLDKMDKNSDAYKTAKEQYDSLEKAIKAIQDLNGQFDKPVIVDGAVDETATAKAGANLAASTTGISAVDRLIASAVNLGRSQLETPESSQAETAPSTSAEVAVEPSQEEPVVSQPAEVVTEPEVTVDSSAVASYGIGVPAGVTLQRELSRVPYNQAAIQDSSNPAWDFNPGILENIIAISQQRGYITGDQYILDRVNIINGNGYYNLFKPDGTYLFSLNAKTGYFVGNAAGNSDALDY